jgi:hypothetical protein
MRSAPSFLPVKQPPTAPTVIVRRLLARFGDRRFIRRIELGPPPPRTLQHVPRPPSDALWAYIYAPAASDVPASHPKPGEHMVAQWEAGLVSGALRDDFCAAGGRPLAGATVVPRASGHAGPFDGTFALLPRFPNPSPQAFRRRVELIGRRYGFRIVSLRLLRPRELAPLLVVETQRERKAFVRDVPAIVSLLNPRSSDGQQTAQTFEGIFFEARDAKGPFVGIEQVYRGWIEGGQWSWDRFVYPYPHG